MELDFRKDPAILGDIVDAMAIGVFTVDAHGRFVAWSAGAERITGFGQEEVLGKPCQILEGPTCKGFAKLQEMLRSPEGPCEGICNQECKIMAHDGRELYIHGSVRLLFDETGGVRGAVGNFMDMTGYVLANEKIAILEKQVRGKSTFQRMIGQSPAMQEVFRKLKLAADSEVTVLLTGESGTGKELAARAIHAESDRREKPFIAINCSAMPESLLESELFGHVTGAFTGAVRDKMGVFQTAHGGTLFLDEIGDVSPVIQVKLLRALQEREIRRVGDEGTIKIDVRLITATNKDLKSLIHAGSIREDFYYRIHVFEICLPALRQRREDIPLLVDCFIETFNNTFARKIGGTARDAMQRLMHYHWPGNVRELRNAIEHAFVTAGGDRITFLDLPAEIRQPRGDSASNLSTPLSQEESNEKDRIFRALQQTGGNRTRAAEILGISRVTLWKKIGQYHIELQ